MSNAVDELLRESRIWRAGDNHDRGDCLPSGFAELDAALPGGGWPNGALTELLHANPGIGELQLVLPALARLSRTGRWIALVAPPQIPYAPALAAHGVDLSRLLLVHPRAGSDTLWALEQAMRSGSCAAVLAWPRRADDKQLRRLQLAAETGRCWGLLFRDTNAAQERSPAALRLALQGDGDDDTRVDLLKVQGGQPRQGLRLNLNNPRTRSLPVPATTEPAVRQPEPATRSRAPEASSSRTRDGIGQMQLPLGPRRPRTLQPLP